MTFGAVGISHWKSKVSVREQFYLNNKKQRLLEEELLQVAEGVLILDTCNRTEVYGFCDPEKLLHCFCNATGTDADFFNEHGYMLQNDEAITHLYEVGLGLDSQILGDIQIIQQLKKAYKKAKKGPFASEFHELVQSVFRAHKRSRSETDFGKGSASVGSAATQVALNYFKDLGNINILLVGAGKMGKVSCKNLISNGATHISVVNRTIDRAKVLASNFDIKAHSFSELEGEIEQADLIITATGAENYILTPSHFQGRTPKKQLVLDLAVPRNVQKEVGDIEGVTLVDMDSIDKANREAMETRKAAIPHLREIIREEKEAFFKKIERTEYLLPKITHINSRLDSITSSELERVKNQLDGESYEKLEEVTHRIKKKILAIHIDRLEKDLEAAQNEA